MRAIQEYNDDDFIQLSGIQHFAFCKRQWALIAIEKAWAENYLTIDGQIMHQNAHKGISSESRGDIVITRGLPVRSETLGVQGICDVVEFQRADTGVELYGRKGFFNVRPIEYKRGVAKAGDEDILQLAAQCICLEEMLQTQIDTAFLYYGTNKRRLEVTINSDIRMRLNKLTSEMHRWWNLQTTPLPNYEKKCESCSLISVCMPKTQQLTPSAKKYVEDCLSE